LPANQIKGAEVSSLRASLWLRSGNGEARQIEAKHIIAATAYRADMRRLPFPGAGIASELKPFDNLFFVGPAVVENFGPFLRFACGAKFTASRLSNYLTRTSRVTKR
jgi:hypothetical protein